MPSPPNNTSLEEMLGAGLRVRPQQIDHPPETVWAMVVKQIEDPAHGYQCGGWDCRSGIYVNERALVVPQAVRLIPAVATDGEEVPSSHERFPSLYGMSDSYLIGDEFPACHRVWDTYPLAPDDLKPVLHAYENVMGGEFLGNMQELVWILMGDAEPEPEDVGMERVDMTDDEWCEEYNQRVDKYVTALQAEVEQDEQTMQQAVLDKQMKLPPHLQRLWRDLQAISRKGWLWVAETYPENMMHERTVFDPWY